MKRRFRRTLLLLPLVAVAAALYAGAVVTPEIGEPLAARTDTAPAASWRFGFVGDTQLGREIVDRVFARLRDAHIEFVLHLGDIVDNADDDDEWHFVLGKAAEYGLRLRPVVGNHDRLLDSDDRGETRFAEFFPELDDTFYAFEHRGVGFLMLNSERTLAPWSEQGRFLASKLAELPRPTVVCLHRPVFTCGHRDLANQFIRRFWLHGRLVDSPAVMVLSGHHHYYDRTKPLDGITYVVSGGGSKKLYEAEPPDDTTAAFRAGTNHFGVVDVYGDRFNVEVLDLAGQAIDRFAVAGFSKSAAVPHASGPAMLK
jgi:predicted phosphodiesterase